MNIKILHSWLKDYLDTKATPQKIAEAMSLSSISIERVEKYGESDFVYDIEVTTNRPDLLSVVGLAREAGAVLPEHGIEAKFKAPKFEEIDNRNVLDIKIENDPMLVNRICAVVLEFDIKPSPKYIQERLTSSEINPHNNVIDVTNYVMREIGHPMHAFDYDKITTKKMIVRESKPGEKIVTLDGAEHTLPGGDIVIDDGTGQIIDLMGVKGTANSAISETTKRVLLFVDNNNRHKIRKTSMTLGVRTDAAQMNEKGIDVELTKTALLRGVELLREIGGAKILCGLTDIYVNKLKPVDIEINTQKINAVIGIEIPQQTTVSILKNLGFLVREDGTKLNITVPSFRIGDVEIEEDIIEEVARVYGYHKLPSFLPTAKTAIPYNLAKDRFFWEQKTKETLKAFGFTEIYTYSMVSEDLLEVAPETAIKLKNPLDEEHEYMRTTIVPSLLEAVKENKNRETLKIFELANVYLKKDGDLPNEELKLAGVIKAKKANFLDIKGVLEALLEELGIEKITFKRAESGSIGADVFIGSESLGEIEILDDDLIDFELDFETILKYVSLKKVYKPISKFPESTEDLRFEINEDIAYQDIEKEIKSVSSLIKQVSLLDTYQNKKTFRIVYQSRERNLTNEDLTELREEIAMALKKAFKATLS